MPAATTKADLIAITEKEFAKLTALLGKIPDDMALQKDAEATSIKDVIGHRAHWIGLFLGWYRDGQRGAAVQTPAPGYKWNQLKDYNAMIRARQADLGWAEACALLRARHADLLALIASLDEAALYGGPMQGPDSHWTTGRWAEASGPSHYRSAAKYLRAQLRQRAGK